MCVCLSLSPPSLFLSVHSTKKTLDIITLLLLLIKQSLYFFIFCLMIKISLQIQGAGRF